MMKKAEFVKLIAEKAHSSQQDADTFLNAFIEATTKALKNGDEVPLPKFGSFVTGDRAARTARNFNTGETIDVPACKVVKFKASQVLKDAIKNTVA